MRGGSDKKVKLEDLIDTLESKSIKRIDTVININNVKYNVTAYKVGENLIRIDLKKKNEI